MTEHRNSSLVLARAGHSHVHHGRLAELAVAAVPWLPSPLMTHRVNQQLRLFLLYDRRTTAEPETTGAAGPSGQLPSPRAAAVAVPPQTISGRAG